MFKKLKEKIENKVIKELKEILKKKTEEIKELQEELNASEAIYAFCGWLTCRDERTIMSSKDDAAIIAELIKRFCDTNNLKEPRTGWEKKFEHPKSQLSN